MIRFTNERNIHTKEYTCKKTHTLKKYANEGLELKFNITKIQD